MARSTARKRALNTLYEADEKGQDILSLLAERLEHPGAQTPLPDYAVDIIRGVAQHRKNIDEILNSHSSSWDVSRMPVVDRNILRIGAWEIIYNEEIPPKVAIDEALGQAKVLSDYDAPNFIHGVLSAIADDDQVTAEPENKLSDDEKQEELTDDNAQISHDNEDMSELSDTAQAHSDKDTDK